MFKVYTVEVPQADGTIKYWKFRCISQKEAELLAGWKMYYQYFDSEIFPS